MKEMSYKVFMEKVENRLQALTKEELKEILFAWASEEHTTKRDYFLARLVPPKRREADTTDVNAFLEELEEFYDRVDDGDYCDGWGWDHEILDERDFGDESWAQEMDAFLVEARELLLQGQFEGAEDAYRLLFSTLQLGEEPGHLPGSTDVTSMLEEVLDEHVVSFIRAVYMNSSLEERPEKVYEVYSGYKYWSYEKIAWNDIFEVIHDPLPDFEEFLEEWIVYLKDQGREANELLREALILKGGSSALSAFAGDNTKEHPEAYLDWLALLQEEGTKEDLLRVTREGLGKIPKDYTDRAKVAEYLVEIGEDRGNTELIMEGLWEAFFSSPSLISLLNLYRKAWDIGTIEEVRDRVKERILDLLQKETPPHYYMNMIHKSNASPSLLVHALLLGGQDEEVFTMVQEEDRDKSISSIFFGYALFLLSREGSCQRVIIKEWKKGLGHSLEDECIKKYLELIEKNKNRKVFKDDEEEVYLSWALEEVDSRVNKIVQNKVQSQYPQAAISIMAMAETLINRNEKQKGKELVIKYRERFPRHRAFLRELTGVVEYSDSLDA